MIHHITRVRRAAEEVAERLVNLGLPLGHPIRHPCADPDWTPDGEFRGAWVNLKVWVPAAEVEAQLGRKGG